MFSKTFPHGARILPDPTTSWDIEKYPTLAKIQERATKTNEHEPESNKKISWTTFIFTGTSCTEVVNSNTPIIPNSIIFLHKQEQDDPLETNDNCCDHYNEDYMDKIHLIDCMISSHTILESKSGVDTFITILKWVCSTILNHCYTI